MKTMLFAVGIGLVALCGCGDSAKQRALEKRVQELEIGHANLRNDFRESLELHMASKEKLMASLSNAAVNTERMAEVDSAWRKRVVDFMHGEDERVRVLAAEELERQLAARAAQFKAGAKPVAQAAPARPVEGFKDGVPVAVWNQIAARAEKEWPGNFTMQAYEIKNQVEAWHKVNR